MKTMNDGPPLPRLDPEALRAYARYARRDWSAPEKLARRERVARPVAEKVKMAVQLYEAARATRPEWPDEATRRADFEHHLRLRALLDKAAHVGAR